MLLRLLPACRVAGLLCVLTLLLARPSLAGLQDNLTFSERFEGNQTAGVRFNGSGFVYRGSTVVPTGPWGRSLRLDAGTSVELSLPHAIQAGSGTISFWVQPFWKEDDDHSHTFLSLAWDDSKRSYLTLSSGWWEPQGAKRFYFVVSNQEFIHCSVRRRLPIGVWTMITAVWNSGPNGYCRLYINGERVAESHRAFLGDYVNNGPIYLGSDRGTTQQNRRSAESLMDEITIYSKALSDENVTELFHSQEKDPQGALARKWQWLEQGLALPRQSARLPTGELLESRVMFDEDMHWAKSKQTADQILGRLKAAGFNVYVPCVWHGNGTYYPTRLTEPDPKLAAVITSEDPLAYLIGKAHALGIEVHPWFTVVRRENNRYPEWYSDGVPDGAYDVHNPRFREFIVDLMLDVVKRYNIDGINLDYIRAMGLCTSSSCQDDYRRTGGNAFWPDYALRGVIGTARTRLEQWQDGAVRDIMQNFVIRAKQLKPNLVISVDGHPKPHTEHRALEGRNEVAWVNEGLIDVIFAMDYRETIDYEGLDVVRRDLHEPERLVVLFGNYDRVSATAPAIPRLGDLVAKYAIYAQHKWPSRAVAFYLYGQMNNDQLAALRDGPFKEPAVPSWSQPRQRRPADNVLRAPHGLTIH